MSIILIIVILLIGVSIFINGWTDASNAIATVISTRVLSPKAAIVVAMIFNLLGVFFLGSAVAVTMANIVAIGTGRDALITVGAVQLSVIIWAIMAWRYGIPTSGTHALIAALMGAGISINGIAALNVNLIVKVVIGIFASSAAGFILSFLVTRLIEITCQDIKRRAVNKFFSRGQIVSVALITFSNGAQDGQKFMGMVYFALVAGGVYLQQISANIIIPFWIKLFCAFLMTVGISAGGYRIIKKMGMEMVHLEKYQGFAAEIVASGSMIVSTLLGIPVSSTNIKGSSMMGAGAARGINKVNWNVAKEMILAWVLTFPICMALGYLLSAILREIL